LALSDWLFAEAHRVHAISLDNRARYLARHLIEVRGEPPDEVCDLIEADFEASGRRPPKLVRQLRPASADTRLPERQRRHLGTGRG
jgi:hypothetical protein